MNRRKYSMEDLKAHWGKYVKGGIGGAIVVLIAGFAWGPLTTNGSAEQLAITAVADRDTTYCVANAAKLVSEGRHAAPTSSTERTDLAKASYSGLLPDASFGNAAFRNCSRAFPKDFALPISAVQ